MANFGDVATNQALIRQVVISLDDFRDGSTPPTASTVGITPTVPVKLFDATVETVSTNIAMPADWDETASINLVLVTALVSAQINGDVVDWTCDYIAVDQPSGRGNDLFTKTSSQATGSTTVTTTDGLAADTQYTTTINIPVADANNPLSADTVSLIVEIHLTNLVDIARIHLIGARLEIESSY